MAQIDKPGLHFNTVLYVGNGGTKNVTGVGFQPDFCWLKVRDGGSSHALFDVLRGVQKRLVSNDNAAQLTQSGLTSFDSDGFTLGSQGAINGNSGNHVAWNWKAGGSGSANTDGDINSTVSANTTSGFSIVKYTGSGSAQTVGHGLGAVPRWIIVKRIEAGGYDWVVYHADDTAGLYLNSTGYNNDSSGSAIWFNGTAPTSSVFTTGTDGRIGNAVDYIAYCFAEKRGFSKFGKYTGNGSGNGAFIYTGFKPAWVMIKRTNNSTNWAINDTARDFNSTYGNDASIYANTGDAETTSSSLNIDLLSNGMKLRSSNASFNDAGSTYIYMAFAENPIVGSNNIPAVAE